ncbi:Holliday junction branch migration DNA helicase RuvB [Mycoplasma putrefaciens]|uniref:Holliday junction branch migration complex subunit RuvB n=1 Tax=Mycoplasma putrefaciens Mput9231 TaxID=1292033 RepID=M9WD46_9MOLU|nr:Holliday junction branch migration DNA helicase RuvB [Mycoplasma putrefaciens]AGJ90746.1 Holliday junction DNA helicase RuvB [Mycoplasma putrefaciens Mput9231]
MFRPETWDEYIGQDHIISNLKIFLASAKKQNKVVDHIFLYGPSGYGKTSLAFLLSKQLKTQIRILNGPSLQKSSDIISVLTSIKEKDIIFIDEIHAVNKEILEIIYPTLEENKLNIIIGKDYNSKVVNIELPKFTMIVATTEINKIPIPLLNRFPISFTLEEYDLKDMSKIVELYCKKLNLKLEECLYSYIANHCRQTPRIAINLIKRINDHIVVDNPKTIDINYIDNVFNKLGIFKLGLTVTEIKYLKIISKNKVMGLENISHLLNTTPMIISNNIEPFLIRQNLIIRTFKGREITLKGYEYIKDVECF